MSYGRSKSPFIKTETVTTPEDGQSWRKYGQKFIHKSTNPRYTCICVHMLTTRQLELLIYL